MDVPTILRAMAAKVATVEGVNAAHYPAPDTISKPRTAVLYWGSDVDTTIERGTNGGELWLPAVKMQLLTPRTGSNTPREFALIDDLITPVVDAFRVDPDGGGASRILPGLPGHLDRVFVDRIRPTLLINYAGSDHYGAELFFSMKFRRR